MEAVDFSVSYSFGGKPDAPLVQRKVAFFIQETHPNLQEALLERTDLIIQDLCAVFDEAFAALEASEYTDGGQVDVCMGACAYCVNNILVQAPSVKYAHMFFRVQRLLNAISDHLRYTLSPRGLEVLQHFLLPVWETLLRIDATFAKDLAALPTVVAT